MHGVGLCLDPPSEPRFGPANGLFLSTYDLRLDWVRGWCTRHFSWFSDYMLGILGLNCWKGWDLDTIHLQNQPFHGVFPNVFIPDVRETTVPETPVSGETRS